MGRTFEGHKGSILIMTIMFLVVLTIVAMALLNTVLYNTTNANVQYNSTQALYLAEAGINKAIYYLRNTAPDGTSNGSWRTTVHPAAAGNTAPASCTASDPCEENLGDGSYTMWVEDSGSNIKITSTGNFNGINRTAQQQIIRTTAGSSGLIGFWRFNEASGSSASDSSGAGNTGNLTNGPSWTTGYDDTGSGLSFDGTNDYVALGAMASVDAQADLTVMGWAKRSSSTSRGMLFNSYVNANNWLGLQFANDTNVYAVVANGALAYGYVAVANTNWHHYALVFDGAQTGNANRLKLYIDGVAQTLTYSGTIPATTPTVNTDANIGYDVHNGVYMNGRIDDVRVYNRALTQDEVLQIYSGFLNVDDEWQECKVLCS